LFSALTACSLAAAILFAVRIIAIHLEHSTIPSTAPELFPVKTQGLAFQRAAAHARDVLLIYGSSELLWPKQERASDFFRTAPAGFQVSPVGKPGTTSMIILQKLGALGLDLRGKKLAISISPGWFLTGVTRADWYEGNFSLFAASQMAFGSALDFELKRDIASRMLRFPRMLAKSPLLEFALRRLASGRWYDQVVFYALWPLGKIQNAILDLQDHFAALAYVLHETKSAPRRHSEILDWSKLIAKAGERKVPHKDKIFPSLPANFVAGVNSAPEWMDLELLLRTLATIHARPLLLSMPMDGQSYNLVGISRSVREVYYKKVRAFARRYNFALVEFEEHDDDPGFLDSQHTHLTAKGWMFYNRALDDFFHERTPER
jgi:D-alanine transfer protein